MFPAAPKALPPVVPKAEAAPAELLVAPKMLPEDAPKMLPADPALEPPAEAPKMLLEPVELLEALDAAKI